MPETSEGRARAFRSNGRCRDGGRKSCGVEWFVVARRGELDMPEKRTKTARKGTKPATLPELQAWLLNSGLLRTRRLNMAIDRKRDDSR